MEAAQFAAAIGLPFNRHVTIHWERAGVPDNRAAAATARFLKLASDWLAKRNSKPDKQRAENGQGRLSFAWAWVRENDAGGDCSKGSHVHILLHVPLGAIWTAWRLRRWLERVSGQPYRKGVIRTARIGGSARAAATASVNYLINLDAVVRYVLKGASAKVARSIGLERWNAGGRIIGKRTAFSQNIGPAAQRYSLKSEDRSQLAAPYHRAIYSP